MTPSLDICPAQYGESRTAFLIQLLADHLPVLPRHLLRLQCVLEDCSTDLEKASAALAADHGIAQNFIRIAGMALQGESGASLDQLIVLLGKHRVWTVAVASFVLTQLDNAWASPAFREMARLAQECGARSLAMVNMIEDEAPEQAYVAGVLSILGLLPLMDLDSMLEESADWIGTSREAIQRQRERFGTDCFELGCWISLLWRIPVKSHEGTQSLVSKTMADRIPGSVLSRELAERNLLLMPSRTI